MPRPLVSILLPTWNGADTLPGLLANLASQELDGEVEIVAFDSGSTDGTIQLLEQSDAKLFHIENSEFSHGGTRNRIAAEAQGDYLVFLSQDVQPVGTDFLAELLKPFSDVRVAGVCARVLPFPGTDPLTARTVLDLPEASSKSSSRDLDEIGPVWAVDVQDRLAYVRFNNVASAIRADVFRKFPFPEVAFGEDFAWAARVLTAGYRLAFTGACSVYHSHEYTPREAYKRYETDSSFHVAAHGWNMRPTLVSVARGVLFELLCDWKYIQRNGWNGARYLLSAPALRFAQVWGQYKGARKPHILNPCEDSPASPNS